MSRTDWSIYETSTEYSLLQALGPYRIQTSGQASPPVLLIDFICTDQWEGATEVEEHGVAGMPAQTRVLKARNR